MMWSGQPGKCLLVPSGPDAKQHLFTVAIGPCVFRDRGPQQQVLLLSVCSVRAGFNQDDACILSPDDHEFIKHASYVHYREPRIEPVVHVQEMLKSGVWKEKEPFDPKVLQRIIAGLEKSRRVPQANNEANFAAVFKRQLESLFIERMEGNEEIFTRLMNDKTFHRMAADYLAGEVYRRIHGA